MQAPHIANFHIFSRMGFHHVGQPGLKLLTSSDPSVLASQTVGITGVSHYTRHKFIFYLKELGKEEQTYSKDSGGNEMIKIREEINKIENRKP